jgi:type II secretory pathway component GspD/PulD (secretin)
MRRNAENAVRWRLCVLAMAGLGLAVLTAVHAGAQEQAKEQKPPDEYRTLYLLNSTGQRDANDIQTDLRNMLPRARVYFVGAGNAISIRGSAEDIALAQKLLADIDRPRKTYRLTYTISDGDSGHPAQHFVVVVSGENKTMLKQGTRVPLVTGADTSEKSQSTQVQYADVGLSLEASVSGYGDGMRLHTKFEQSSVADEKSGVGAQDPMFHQSVLESESAIAIGKLLVLGSVDMSGSSKRLEVSVVAEVVK